MVMFNCNRCSAGMKKKDVEKHSFKCGGKTNINVTCIDCLKDFRGNEYESHTSCLTEDQRYGGKDAVSKPTGVKQNQWLGIVKTVLKQKDSLDADVVKFLKSAQHTENIPRNRKKFQNWARSAKHITDTQFLDKVFDILIAEFEKTKQTDGPGKNAPAQKPAGRTEAENGTNDGSAATAKKSKKRQSSESGVENGNGGTEGAEEATGQNGENAPESEAGKQLSKKERKQLKKKAKYEQEVKEIESAVAEEPPRPEEAEPAKKSKKSKKRKLAEVDGNAEGGEDGKKRKVEEGNAEKTEDSPLNGDGESPKKTKAKFNWHETIVEVVRQAKNSEISLKKLAKKVIGEYVSRYGDSGIQEKLQAKLNKKVTHCPGVKVLKDRAKLVERED